MIVENYAGYNVPKNEIDITDPYQENVLYDVVTAVRALDNPTYADVERYLNYIYSTDMVVNFLRWGEKHGYLFGHSGFYSKYGGGAKRWDYVKLPEYPYRWLEKVEFFKRVESDNWRWMLFKFYGYNLLVRTAYGKTWVMAISKDYQTIERLYMDAVDRYAKMVIRDSDEPDINIQDAGYMIYTADYDIKQPMPTGLDRGCNLIWDGGPVTFPTCRRCSHNKGVLYQFVNGIYPHILNTILCECRPHTADRVWEWYRANFCKEYDQVV